LWRERKVKSFGATRFYQTSSIDYSGRLEVEFIPSYSENQPSTNFRVGDIVNVYDAQLTNILNNLEPFGYTTDDGLNLTVLDITNPIGATQGQKIIFDVPFYSDEYDNDNPIASFKLVYNQLVQYIGEINGVNNVNEANRSYTEIFAQIPDHTGMTPDILFRTLYDVSPDSQAGEIIIRGYGPNLTFPILPRQYQAEIMGAENFNSPIVSTPQNYPGSYYGQFDTNDFTYETATGDISRRTGDYFGVTGQWPDNITIDGSKIDGITIDFDTSHYVKMNIPKSVSGKNLTNFEQFNSPTTSSFDADPRKDFEFNAILWYYTVEKEIFNANGTRSTQTRTNLYGISFLNNPNQNTTVGEESVRFPTYKKLVSNGKQDGTSYAFNLNLNFNIINDNANLAYNPESINSMFNMTLFNQAMARLASTNESFSNILNENSTMKQQIEDLKSLIYTQTDISVLNNKISNLENLLRLYSTIQISDSPSIKTTIVPGNPVRLTLDTLDTPYSEVRIINTSIMYNQQGNVPITIYVPENKKFLVQLINNDEVELDLPSGEKLTLVIDRDLSYKQSMELNILPSQFSSENKKLDIFIKSSYNGSPTDVLILGDINLPVSFNKSRQTPNSAYLWKESNLNIDFTKSISLLENNRLQVPFSGDVNILTNTIKVGDSYQFNNLFVGTVSVYDFSGQYVVDSIAGITSSYATFNISSNKNIVDYGASASLPLEIHGTSSTMLSNFPYLSLNKGKKIIITRISDSNNISERYYVEESDII
jgi:hypothetical protein